MVILGILRKGIDNNGASLIVYNGIAIQMFVYPFFGTYRLRSCIFEYAGLSLYNGIHAIHLLNQCIAL